MESSEEEIIMLRMCCSAASAVLIGIVVMLRQMLEDARRDYNNVPREPSQMRDLNRNVHMYRILSGDANSCLEHLRMRRGPFLNLATLMRDGGLLKDTIHVPVEEQLAMFLHIVGNKSKNRVMSTDFIRSGETVSRYFNKVLGAISCLRDRFMKQAPSETPAEVRESTLFYPFFMDCIGLVDGIHIDAMVPTKYVVRFRGRKGVTQNVLAAATPDKRFTYVMAGWEGSASDFRILKDALSLPHPHGLRVYEVKMDDPPEVAHNQGGKGIQEVTGGKVSPVAWAQPMSPSDVAGQSSRSLKYQPVFFQPVFLQQAIPGAALPPMLAQTSQAIPGATIPPILAQTSQSSGTQLPSHGDGNGSSQKYIRGREVEEISSSSKRTKKEGSNKSKRSGESRNAPNKMWQDKHDDVLIPFLADLAKKGYKCDKSFKKEAFSQATDALNSHFGENFTTENVYNHMKSLKRRYVYMCECLKISGASWDEESKMIKLDQFPCENWDKVNPNLKDYVNKPLKHFDDLSVIIGDAFATGEFRKGVYNKFGGIPAQTINIDSDEHKEDAPNNQETSPSEPIRETPKFKKSQMTHGTSLDTSHARPRVRRTERAHMDSNMKIMEKMVEKVGEMAFAIQNAHLKHWSERLSDKVYALTQFPQHVLDHAFETLYEDERQARLFIARPIPSQVAWMNAHVSKFGLHTSDEIVTDEDGMGAEQREGT